MSNNTYNDTAVYVDKAALAAWGVNMSKINDGAVEILRAFEKSVDDLIGPQGSWNGNSANGFKNATDNLMTEAKSYHDKMGNVEQFLNTVIETMESE